MTFEDMLFGIRAPVKCQSIEEMMAEAMKYRGPPLPPAEPPPDWKELRRLHRAELKVSETALYRHFNAKGDLLYVGLAVCPLSRTRSHKVKSWYRDVANITIEWFDSREAADMAETKAILSEKPLHNIAKVA